MDTPIKCRVERYDNRTLSSLKAVKNVHMRFYVFSESRREIWFFPTVFRPPPVSNWPTSAANNDFRPINAAWSFVHRITDSWGAAHCVCGACCYADRRVLPNYVRQQSRSNVDRHRRRGGSHGEFSTGFRSGFTNLRAASTCCCLRVDLSRSLRVVKLWYVLGVHKTRYTIVREPSDNQFTRPFFMIHFFISNTSIVLISINTKMFCFHSINLNRIYWYFFYRRYEFSTLYIDND